ncbi:hypothetical protein B0H16DRAFT_432387 [Mycena metata]|uniref:Uncharacterized protein n=1 Tax=Mycena metata TaxID=1033252 RepID=A0AAD7JHI0_9AGAR|nr:hypothetical protein B0H16DRAFT_432387 [Mycena metata]
MGEGTAGDVCTVRQRRGGPVSQLSASLSTAHPVPTNPVRLIGSHRVLSIWPTYSVAPTLEYFAWSPLIAQALSRNSHVLSAGPLRRADPIAPLALFWHRSQQPLPPICAPDSRAPRSTRPPRRLRSTASASPRRRRRRLGVQREEPPRHTHGRARLRRLPVAGAVDVRVADGETRHAAATRAGRWCSAYAMYARARRGPNAVSRDVQALALNRMYISTDAAPDFVHKLSADLEVEGWAVFSPLDLGLNREEQAVDMSVLVTAEEFVGWVFTSCNGGLRVGARRPPSTSGDV